MRAKVICFASAKGGTGKTVISATFAKFLASLDKKVLLIDMDAATNGLSLFYLEKLVNARKCLAKEKTPVHGIFEVIEGELPTPFKIYEATDMIPTSYVMEQTEDISRENFKKSISETLSAFRDKYNYIILDSQAGSDIYAQIAMENADEVVIVSEYDPISAQGVDRLRHLFPKALSYDRTWILFNKVLPEFAKSLSDFLSAVRYLSPIPWDAEVVRAFARKRLAINMERGNDYTLAIMQTAHFFLGEEIEEEINHWKQDKEKLLREPVQRQLGEIEEEISYTEVAKIETEYQLKDLQEKPKRLLVNILITFIAPFVVMLTIINPIYKLFELSLFGYPHILMLVILFVGLLTILEYTKKIERRTREEIKKIVGQSRALDLRLEDLKERRQKYRILVESDLETFLKKR